MTRTQPDGSESHPCHLLQDILAARTVGYERPDERTQVLLMLQEMIEE